MINDRIQIVLIAAACTGAVGLAGMGAIRLLGRASLRLSIQASGIVLRAIWCAPCGGTAASNERYLPLRPCTSRVGVSGLARPTSSSEVLV